MTNSFLILFITIKVEIALILQGVSINTHSVMTRKKKKDSPHFSNSLPSPLPHIHFLFYLSSKKKILKNILKEIEKK